VWTRTRLGAVGYLLLLPALLYALVLTGSRSGIVGLATTLAIIWFHSRRKVILSIAVLAALAITVPQLSPAHVDRYLSIVESNTQNAATAEGRVEGIKADLRVAMRRPLLGHGLGTSLEANVNFDGRYQPSHNLATEILQELGIVGLAIFMGLLASIVATVVSAIRRTGEPHGSGELLFRANLALQVWLGMNIVFSFFSYGLSRYEWYFAAGLANALTLLSTGATGRAPTDTPPAPLVHFGSPHVSTTSQARVPD